MRKLTLFVVLFALLAISLVPAIAQEDVVTLWSRSANEAFVRRLVDEWNATHDAQIEVTIIPSDQFVTRVATGFAAGEVPDLLPIDLIYVPRGLPRAGQLLEISAFCR